MHSEFDDDAKFALGASSNDCGPTVVIGEASEKVFDLEKEKGEGSGENPLSENSVVEGDEVPQPKKVPSLDDPGDLGSGLSVLGVFTS